MEIGNGNRGGSRLRHRIAAAELIGAKSGARPIVGADPREADDLPEHRFPGIGLHAPDVGAVAQGGLENDDRAAGAAAREIQLRPPPMSTSWARSAPVVLGSAERALAR